MDQNNNNKDDRLVFIGLIIMTILMGSLLAGVAIFGKGIAE